jgi:hypothetical protein
MTRKLLNSQFYALEEPANTMSVDVSEPPQVIVENIRTTLVIPNSVRTTGFGITKVEVEQLLSNTYPVNVEFILVSKGRT